MWLASILSALVCVVSDPPSAASPAGPAPIFSRQSLFAIPFHIDRPERITQEPIQVQLYVSGDRGATWDFYSKTEPAKLRVLFRAGQDGEYWFCIRTLDRSGQVRPAGPPMAGLIVVVDTTPPKLQFDARRGDAGQIVASFRIDEIHPNLDSLAIQYRTGPNAPWQRVATSRQDIHSAGNLHSGEVTWWPPSGGGVMEIRAEFCDMAGNPAVSNAQVLLTENRVVGAAPTGQTPPAGNMAAGARPANDWRPSNADAPPIHWPAENAANGQSPVSLQLVDNSRRPEVGSVALRVNPPIQNQYVAQDQRLDQRPVNPANAPVGGNPFRATAASYAAPGGIPAVPRIRMVNSRAFELEYDAESVGPSGIGRVELWGTRDGGVSWRSYGVDDRRHSPMLVTVEDEGLYGFRIVIQSGAGLGGNPPHRGDQPEVWIGVDMTKPVGRITGVQQGAGPDLDKLNITWEATDNQKLAGRPISLSYAETLGGPWNSIVGNLENTGRYTWLIDHRVPQRVYLRLEVRDEAGNVGMFETPEPVSIDHAIPSARIRDVYPLGQTSYRSPDQSYWR